MKKLLNSVWGIAGLCIIGAVLIGWRIVIPVMQSNNSEFVDEDAGFGEEDDWLEAETSIEAVRHTLTAVDASTVNWNPAPLRDPFAVQRAINKTDIELLQTQQAKDASYRPTLNALVSGSHSKLAIIDGKVVVKGDRVANYLVTSIGTQGVGLLHQLDGTSSLITVNRR